MDIEYLHGNRVTVAVLRAEVGGLQRRFHGIARCNPEDPFRPEIGKDLATARAIAALAKAYTRRANGAVKFHDNAAKARIKAASQPESAKRRPSSTTSATVSRRSTQVVE